jgi:steroid delta-isomerase-like uncharacterized protein
MSAQHETLVRRWVDEVLNRGELAVIDELYAPDFINLSQPAQPPGPAGVKEGVTQLRAAFSDLQVTIDDLVTGDDRVAWLYTARGTHSGSFGGIPPTGKSVEYRGSVLARVADGRFSEGRGVVDMLSLVQQLGLIQSAPAQ